MLIVNCDKGLHAPNTKAQCFKMRGACVRACVRACVSPLQWLEGVFLHVNQQMAWFVPAVIGTKRLSNYGFISQHSTIFCNFSFTKGHAIWDKKRPMWIYL